MRKQDSSRDDLDLLLEEQVQDERFKAAYEDAAARSRIVRSLIRRRKVRNISQSAVAKLMQTTQSAVSDLEGGSTDPRLSTLQRYARTIGCRIEVCVKDYPASWQADCFRAEVTINPVQIVVSGTPSDWHLPVSRTRTHVGGQVAVLADKDVTFA